MLVISIFIMSNKPLYCSFCKNIGIPGPHSHIIRDLNSKEKEITCPRLLANECTYCHKFGHTKNHCPILTCKLKIGASSYGSNKKRKLNTLHMK